MGETIGAIPSRFSPKLGLFLARFCVSAWIGAASLFVVVGVAEVTRGGFDTATKDLLVSIRFPAFYVFGAVLVSLSWLGTWAAGSSVFLPRWRWASSLVLLAVVLAVMAVDYVWIYQPLMHMVSPPGQAKPAQFRLYHDASKWTNFLGLALCLIAAVLLNWPSIPSLERELESDGTERPKKLDFD